MVRIMTDTSTLFYPDEAKAEDLILVPLGVTIADKTYHEFLEIESEEFLELINKGNIPKSSQPPIGETVKCYEYLKGQKIINITMADGLSGAYSSAESAKYSVDNANDITVINSTTLCGPHRFIVKKALKLAKEGLSAEQIIDKIKINIESSKSFLIPQDFDFLVRGGRLMPMAGKIGGALNLIPLMKQSDDGTRLSRYALSRNFSKVMETVVKSFADDGVDENYLISIGHANNIQRAETAKSALEKAFPQTEIEILKLSPAFITQGGPGCISIQIVDKR